MARTSSLRREPVSVEVTVAASSNDRPVDLVHLSHQTMGDEGLEREVLGLLARQIASVSGRLEAAGQPERVRVAHTLRGASLNVGAFRLARAAEALEQGPACAGSLEAFEAEMTVASGFIEQLLHGRSASR